MPFRDPDTSFDVVVTNPGTEPITLTSLTEMMDDRTGVWWGSPWHDRTTSGLGRPLATRCNTTSH
ncbi:MAG TPA: hypothetical protein VGP44_02420 [Gemmatimonadales bacterium]|nr:hypothetical protein [Gemmatimonadales bacterium]